MAFEFTRDMVVVESDDPRVIYSHGWERVPGEPKICSNGSFHRAYSKGATARFEFEGSHIWVIGHKSAAHGNLKVSIDGQPGITTINAWGEARAVVPFQKLFEHEFANPGPHWIEVVNDLSGSEITIDAFAYKSMAPGRTWTTPLGTKLVTVVENDPRMEYTGHWEHSRATKNGNHVGGDAFRRTSTRGATVSLSFESTHFWIIGVHDTSHGIYGVSVDGGLFEVFSGQESKWRGFVILYERRFADTGPHCVVIRNEDGKPFILDAVIYEAPPLCATTFIPLKMRMQDTADPAWSQAEPVG